MMALLFVITIETCCDIFVQFTKFKYSCPPESHCTVESKFNEVVVENGRSKGEAT